MMNYDIEIKENNVIKFNNNVSNVKFNTNLEIHNEKIQLLISFDEFISTFGEDAKHRYLMVKIADSEYYVNSVRIMFNSDKTKECVTLHVVDIS